MIVACCVLGNECGIIDDNSYYSVAIMVPLTSPTGWPLVFCYSDRIT